MIANNRQIIFVKTVWKNSKRFYRNLKRFTLLYLCTYQICDWQHKHKAVTSLNQGCELKLEVELELEKTRLFYQTQTQT